MCRLGHGCVSQRRHDGSNLYTKIQQISKTCANAHTHTYIDACILLLVCTHTLPSKSFIYPEVVLKHDMCMFTQDVKGSAMQKRDSWTSVIWPIHQLLVRNWHTCMYGQRHRNECVIKAQYCAMICLHEGFCYLCHTQHFLIYLLGELAVCVNFC